MYVSDAISKLAVDYREQIDLAAELPAPAPGDPRCRQLRELNQWPNEAVVPGFRRAISTFIDCMAVLSSEFTSLVRLPPPPPLSLSLYLSPFSGKREKRGRFLPFSHRLHTHPLFFVSISICVYLHLDF